MVVQAASRRKCPLLTYVIMKLLAAALSIFSFAPLAQVMAPTYVDYPRAAPFVSGSTLLTTQPGIARDIEMSVLPRSAPAGVRRWVVINNLPKMNCGLAFQYPLVGLDVGRLVADKRATVLSDPPGTPLLFGVCPLLANPLPVKALFSITPPATGTYVVQWAPAGANAASFTVDVETTAAVPAAASLPAIDGMWFDPATNGSGIFFHQAPDRKSVFGTWFMFDSQGVSRWYSLQELRWDTTGARLDGLVVESRGALCAGTTACPAPVAGAAPTLEVRITITGSRAQAEIIGPAGTTLVTSNLQRLEL